MKKLIKKLLFWLVFSKEERMLIIEGLGYGVATWYDSFAATKWKKQWMNERRLAFDKLKEKLE